MQNIDKGSQKHNCWVIYRKEARTAIYGGLLADPSAVYLIVTQLRTCHLFMSFEIEKIMRPDEMQHLGVNSMTETQRQTLASWGMRMYALGQHIVAKIEDIKYDGRLIILDDGSRWEVDSIDASTAEIWSPMDKVVVIDDNQAIHRIIKHQ